MKKLSLFVVLFVVVIIGVIIWNNRPKPLANVIQAPIQNTSTQNPDGLIRYVAVGDSYTIGLGINAEGRWPNVLVKHLNENGIRVELVDNLGISGYTTEDALEREVPEFERLKPDFATLLIGANDDFIGLEKEVVRKNYQQILDRMQNSLSNKTNLLVLTLPDYASSPGGKRYGAFRNLSEQTRSFNEMIKEEAVKRGLKVVDLFPVSQKMTDEDLFISDGLHPSAKGYAVWEKEIYPVVFEMLKN